MKYKIGEDEENTKTKKNDWLCFIVWSFMMIVKYKTFIEEKKRQNNKHIIKATLELNNIIWYTIKYIKHTIHTNILYDKVAKTIM